jgi:hypothetical protein
MAATLAERLLGLAQALVAKHPDFFEVKGPGRGDHATNAFMRDLRSRARREFGADHAEQRICGDNAFRVDYYFRSEATIVEVALGLPRPTTEFERDVLKAVMAKDAGHAVDRLLFISKPGAQKKCAQPGRTAIIKWVRDNHGIEILVRDLGSVLPSKGLKVLRSRK